MSSYSVMRDQPEREKTDLDRRAGPESNRFVKGVINVFTILTIVVLCALGMGEAVDILTRFLR